MSAGKCLLSAFAAIGHNVYRVVPDEVPILDRQNVALERADDREVCHEFPLDGRWSGQRFNPGGCRDRR
jgi:hypothetical protein